KTMILRKKRKDKIDKNLTLGFTKIEKSNKPKAIERYLNDLVELYLWRKYATVTIKKVKILSVKRWKFMKTKLMME
ncbi:hypothetical protein RZS08_33535, partial [Arthrospira platensis SPKY1]|nr:hypothetical protein [Arthrospira platensis SPKY1]